MKLAMFGMGSGICADPAVAARVAQRAEALGYESVWTGEHVVLPDPRKPPSPAAPDFPMLHPSTVLAYVAAVTKTLKLGTGIVLIAQRNPVVLAKEMASLDVLSNGRLILGIGAGYLEPEFAALGVPFRERGARTDEYVPAMRALWTQEKPAFEGKFVRFSGIQSRPRPVQPGGPPIVVGGASDAAFERAVRYAQGWYGFAMDLAQTKQCIARLGEVAARTQRPKELGALEISITPRGRITREARDEFAAAGVHRLISLVPQDSEESLIGALEGMAKELIA